MVLVITYVIGGLSRFFFSKVTNVCQHTTLSIISFAIIMFIIWQAPRAGKMKPIPRCDWLLTRAGKMGRYCPLGIARFVPAITFRRSPSGCTKVFFRKIFSVTVKRFSVISLSGWN